MNSTVSQKTKVTKFNIFSWVKNIICDKKRWEEFSDDQHAEFNTYLILRFISMNPSYIELVNYIQTVPYAEKKQYHEILCELIPKSSRYFSPYIKKNKAETNKDLLKYITEFYQCSLEEAEDYFTLLGEEGTIEILSKLGIDEKQIKKLLK